MRNDRSDAPPEITVARVFRNRRVRHVMLSVISRVLNPLNLAHAGSRQVKFMAVVVHRGRRSGRAYETPTNARRTADGFVIPMTFGKQADWFRNVQAAGGCVIRWNGIEYPVDDPDVVDWPTAKPAFSWLERALVPLFGIEYFVRLRDSSPDRLNRVEDQQWSLGIAAESPGGRAAI